MKKTKKMQNLKLFYQIISKCELFERRVFHIFYIFNESKYKEVDGRCHKVWLAILGSLIKICETQIFTEDPTAFSFPMSKTAIYINAAQLKDTINKQTESILLNVIMFKRCLPAGEKTQDSSRNEIGPMRTDRQDKSTGKKKLFTRTQIVLIRGEAEETM